MSLKSTTPLIHSPTPLYQEDGAAWKFSLFIMNILWRNRLTLLVLGAVLFLLGCEAQIHGESPAGKLLYARGNHWAVGHLMGKKSVDEALGPDSRSGDRDGYLVTTLANRDIQTSRLLRALLTQLTAEQRTPRVSRERDFNQADVLLLALDVRDADGG